MLERLQLRRGPEEGRGRRCFDQIQGIKGSGGERYVSMFIYAIEIALQASLLSSLGVFGKRKAGVGHCLALSATDPRTNAPRALFDIETECE